MQIWIASIAAVIVQPIVFLARIAPYFSSPEPFDGLGFVLFMVMTVAAAAVLVLGIPLFFLLRKCQRDSWTSLAFAGLLFGALPAAALSWPRHLEGYSAGNTWHGKYVDMYIHGVPTSYAWLSYAENVAYFGLHGLIGALVFYSVWRKLTNHHSPFDTDALPRRSTRTHQNVSLILNVKENSMQNADTTSASENAGEFSWRKDDVFGRIADRYDLLCDLFSFGIHRHWKRQVAMKIANEKWLTLLDGATGTGDIVLRVLRKKSLYDRTIIASDISEKMLGIAQSRLAAHSEKVMFRQIDAEKMTGVPNDSIDAYSISLCLKICNRNLALKEAMRVLRPGGRIIILEASNIPWRLLNRAYLAYMELCMPLLGRIATGGDASAYKYLLQGIRDFPAAEGLVDELYLHGFQEVEFERLSFGIVAIHTARKPEEKEMFNTSLHTDAFVTAEFNR